METPEIIVYTDACRLGGEYGANHMSCAWVAIFTDDHVIGPKTKRIRKPRAGGKHDEEVPKKLARHALKALGNLKILTDHPDLKNPAETHCGKRDPWHLVCHYAALASSLRGERRHQEAAAAAEKKSRL